LPIFQGRYAAGQYVAQAGRADSRCSSIGAANLPSADRKIHA